MLWVKNTDKSLNLITNLIIFAAQQKRLRLLYTFNKK